ncbi:uncharacterized protein LOC144887315 [Branchiostoma floridae x Branchiostoma japonicum]
MDYPENLAAAGQVEHCRKNNKPCSKSKGHLGKCDKRRPLQERNHFGQFGLKNQQPGLPQEKTDATHQSLKHSAALVFPQPATNESTAVSEMSDYVEQRTALNSSAGSSETSDLQPFPFWEYRSSVSNKRKRETEQLVEVKQTLEAEIQKLEAEVRRLKQESAGWQEVAADIVRQQEQVSLEWEKLEVERAAVEARCKEAAEMDMKVRKVLDQKGHARTRLEGNPTTVEMMEGKSETWYRRKKLSRECLECINGGPDGAAVAAFGLMVELASYEKIDKLMTKYKKGKYLQFKFNSITQKYEKSSDNIERSLAVRYNGELSRRDYQFQCRTTRSVFDPTKKVYIPRNSYIDGVTVRPSRLVSSSKLQSVVDSMDIGHIHPMPGHVGAMRPLVSLTTMIVDMYLRLPHLRSQLRWFKGRKNHFIFLFADDGTPETKDTSMTVATLTCWNFGKQVRSRNTQFLIHVVSASEKAAVLRAAWGEITFQAGLMEAESITIAGELCTFEFRAGGDESWAATALGETTGAATYPSPWANVSKSNMFIVGGKFGETWKPWTMEQRKADLLKLEEYLSTLPSDLSESVRNTRRNTFMATHQMRQLRSPPIGKYAVTFCPDPLHTEVNAWKQLFDVLYQEAVRRGLLEQFLAVLEAPICLPKVRKEPAKRKYDGKYANIFAHAAAGDRVRQNDDITEQSDNLYRKLLSSLENSDKGEETLLVGVNMKAVATKVREHYAKATTRHTKLPVRFIGENAIILAKYGYRLVDALFHPDEDQVGKVIRLVLGKLVQLLRDAGTLFNQLTTTEADLNELEGILDTYYNLFCLFLPERGNLTVWTVAKAIPYFARTLYDEYETGYGVVSMQGKEAKNAKVKDYLKLTNRSKEEGERNKFFQVFRQEYIQDFYLQEHNPSPSHYNPHYNSRVPGHVGTPGICDCGREIVESTEDLAEEEPEIPVSLCSFCLDALEVVACAKEGQLTTKMSEIMLPHLCQVCSSRFATRDDLKTHMETHITAEREAGNGRSNLDVSKMNRNEIVAELRKRGMRTTGNIRALRSDLMFALQS